MTGSRDVNATSIAAAAAAAIHPVLFAKLQFDSGNVLVHTELGDIAFGGDTYIGVGKFGGTGAAEEVSDLSRTPITLALSGIPSDMISIALGENYQGRPATVYLGYLDMTTRLLVADPTIIYRGNIDTQDITQDKTCTVSVSVESRFAMWATPNVRRYNNADQQSRYPADTGLQYVEQATNKSIFWGAAS